MIANYFELEPALIERIKTMMPELNDVYGMSDLTAIRDRAANLAPCVCVVYDGDTIPGGEGSRGGQGEAQVVFQRWVLWLIVRNVRELQEGRDARNDAGPLASKLIKSIAGWQPTSNSGFRKLRRISAPRPLYDAGTIHIPILFEAPLITV